MKISDLIPAFLEKAPLDPYDGNPVRLRRLAHGIVIYGHTRVQHTAPSSVVTEDVPIATLPLLGSTSPAIPTNRATLVLAAYDSLPLIEDLRLINKVSQNLHAELALRLVGKAGGGIGNSETGLKVEQNFLTQAAQVKLLQYVAAQPWAAKFQDTLPVAGVDGSLADRWKDTDLIGHVRAKTGTMEHVSALSGYAITLSGKNLAFSIMVNNYALRTGRIREVIDQIVQAIVDDQPEKK